MRRRLAATCALTGASLLLAPSAAMGMSLRSTHAAAGSGLVGYSALANAPGIGISGIYMGVSLDVPQANSSLTTGGLGTGLASIAWPGDIGGRLGTAILVVAPTAPSWSKNLDDPVKAETHSTGTRHAVNKTVPGTVMESTATHQHVTASSQTKLSIPALGGVGSFSASSTAELIGPHTIRAVSHSVFTDLKLAGGVIDIGSLTSDAAVISNGRKSQGFAVTTVGGASIGGVPVVIDRQGIHLSKSVIPTAAVTSLLAKTLSALHLTATFTPDIVTRSGGAGSYDAGALVLSYSSNGSTYTVTLGRAAAQVNAPPSRLSGDPSTPPGPSPSVAAPGGTAAGGSSSGLPSGGSLGTGGDSGRAPSVASQITKTASSILLAGGPTGLMVFAVIAATLACAFALPRLAGRFLDVPADAGCEEDV
ncbi:MAG: hypothetical protein ACTHK4_06390 [Mycobacteriales bacterium]